MIERGTGHTVVRGEEGARGEGMKESGADGEEAAAAAFADGDAEIGVLGICSGVLDCAR
jgi:hypothetical protein